MELFIQQSRPERAVKWRDSIAWPLHARMLLYQGGEEMTHIFSIIMLWLFATLVLSPWSAPATAQGSAPAALFRAEELDQLVAPIALYPDSLLAQVLMASTYPLEIVSAARWIKANPKLKAKALDDALQTQTWDPSVKSLAVFPEVLTMMNEKLDWTQKLGGAFLAQQTDVMQAIQRLRSKAQAQGNLKTTQEQKVIIEQPPVGPTAQEQGVVVEQPAVSQTTIIRVEPANPQVVYVPIYNPTVVYGAWPYPAYPPYAYYPPGYVAATSLFRSGWAWRWAPPCGETATGDTATSTSTSTTTRRTSDPTRLQQRAPSRGSILITPGRACNGKCRRVSSVAPQRQPAPVRAVLISVA
jgi:hypothetical protein